MGNIRKFLKYALPIIALPWLLNALNWVYSVAVSQLGVTALAARSAVSNAMNLQSRMVYIIALAVLSICGILAEKGKAKSAKMLHLIGLLLCVSILTIFSLIFIFAPQLVMGSMTSDAEVIGIGVLYARLFTVSVILVCSAAALAAQLSGKHSFVLQMILGGGMIVVSAIAVGILPALGLGVVPLAVADGLSYAFGAIVPFLMLPVERYSADLAPAMQN